MSDDQGQIIQEDNHEPSHYAMIPKMAMLDLDPYELTLYCHYKMTASEHGKCWKSNKTLASETGMSVRQVQESRGKLAEKGFITLTYTPDDSGNINTPPVITIVNVWSENRSRYAKNDAPPMHSVHTPRASGAPPYALSASKEYPSEEKELKKTDTRKRESVFNIAKMSDKQLQAYYDKHAALLDELLLLTGIDVQFCHWREMDLTQRRAYVRAFETFLSKDIDYHAYTAWLTKELIWRKPLRITLKDFVENIPKFRTALHTPKKEVQPAAFVWRTPEPDDPPYPVTQASEQDIPFS